MNVATPIMREGFVEAQRPGAATARPAEEKEKKPPPTMPAPEMEEPPGPDAADFMKEQWPIVVRLLHKKIANNTGELVDHLSFREPRGGDINRYGNPCRVNREGDVVIDERKMHYVMAALCNVLPPMLDAMDPRDWNSCAYRLRDFFLPDLRAWL
jgi:hypothetical protein